MQLNAVSVKASSVFVGGRGGFLREHARIAFVWLVA